MSPPDNFSIYICFDLRTTTLQHVTERIAFRRVALFSGTVIDEETSSCRDRCLLDRWAPGAYQRIAMLAYPGMHHGIQDLFLVRAAAQEQEADRGGKTRRKDNAHRRYMIHQSLLPSLAKRWRGLLPDCTRRTIDMVLPSLLVLLPWGVVWISPIVRPLNEHRLWFDSPIASRLSRSASTETGPAASPTPSLGQKARGDISLSQTCIINWKLLSAPEAG